MVKEVPLSFDFMASLISDTLSFWHSWISKCTYKGRWREMVHRSALLLKLLTYAPTGAIIAAPTFGLPEAFTVYAFLRIGFTDEAMQFMTFIEDRCKEMLKNGHDLRVLYDIRGETPSAMLSKVRERDGWYVDQRATPVEEDQELVSDGGYRSESSRVDVEGRGEVIVKLKEIEFELAKEFGGEKPGMDKEDAEGQVRDILENLYVKDTDNELILAHFDGYFGSRPVRIGNGACEQIQNDIYGELMDAIYLVDKYCRPISYDFWVFIRTHLVPKVIETWSLPDHGIWEFRHGRQHYTYSKIMNWVALDRAIRLSEKRSFPSEKEEWRKVRDIIFDDILKNSWNEERRAFVGYYGSNDLDASNLIMPLVLFLSPTDPRFISTLNETLKPTKLGGLTANNLCFRNSPLPKKEAIDSFDDILKNEGTFNLCSFWLVEAMARAGSKIDKQYLDMAVLKFEDIIGYANHLGLFAEEISITGEALGNFPQAFTHLALISAAFNIDRYMG